MLSCQHGPFLIKDDRLCATKALAFYTCAGIKEEPLNQTCCRLRPGMLYIWLLHLCRFAKQKTPTRITWHFFASRKLTAITCQQPQSELVVTLSLSHEFCVLDRSTAAVYWHRALGSGIFASV